jgi:hypothetical protein
MMRACRHPRSPLQSRDRAKRRISPSYVASLAGYLDNSMNPSPSQVMSTLSLLPWGIQSTRYITDLKAILYLLHHYSSQLVSQCTYARRFERLNTCQPSGDRWSQWCQWSGYGYPDKLSWYYLSIFLTIFKYSLLHPRACFRRNSSLTSVVRIFISIISHVFMPIAIVLAWVLGGIVRSGPVFAPF